MIKDKVCRLCGNSSQLVSSHAIPASALRKTKINGKNVQVKDGQLNKKSQSDGKAPLLCVECDQGFLGKFFDQRGAEILTKARHSGSGYLENSSNIDVADMISGWVLSILWRSHHLETPEYNRYLLPDGIVSDIKKNLLDQRQAQDKYKKWSKVAIISVYRLFDRFETIDAQQAICAFPSLFTFRIAHSYIHCSSFRMLGYEFRVVHKERKKFGIKGNAREVLRSGKRVFTRPHHFLDNPYYAGQLAEVAFLSQRLA